MNQVVNLFGNAPKTATVVRGCKGHSRIGETEILIPKPFNDKSQSQYQQKKMKKHFRRSAGIEPIIDQIKSQTRT